jgi:hypothetical protein
MQNIEYIPKDRVFNVNDFRTIQISIYEDSSLSASKAPSHDSITIHRNNNLRPLEIRAGILIVDQ